MIFPIKNIDEEKLWEPFKKKVARESGLREKSISLNEKIKELIQEYIKKPLTKRRF